MSMPTLPSGLPPQVMEKFKPVFDILQSVMSRRPDVTHFSLSVDILMVAMFTLVFVLLAGWKFATSEGV